MAKEVTIKLDMDDSEKLSFLSEKILPALIWQAVDGDRIHAAGLAAAVTGSILQAVFNRFDEEEEEVPHGPRS